MRQGSGPQPGISPTFASRPNHQHRCHHIRECPTPRGQRPLSKIPKRSGVLMAPAAIVGTVAIAKLRRRRSPALNLSYRPLNESRVLIKPANCNCPFRRTLIGNLRLDRGEIVLRWRKPYINFQTAPVSVVPHPRRLGLWHDFDGMVHRHPPTMAYVERSTQWSCIASTARTRFEYSTHLAN